MISQEFFEKFGCIQYENILKDISFDESNKINSEIVKTSGIYDAIERLKNYTDNFHEQDNPVAAAIVTEILYLIGRVPSFEPPAKGSRLIKGVISYINGNISGDVSLDILTEKFFVSKYHLCHCFKKSTGLTIKEYIIKKRLALASQYSQDGKTLTAAAAMAGFKDYSAFYRAYVKNNNTSPKVTKTKN